MFYPDDMLKTEGEANFSSSFDLVCLSHLRWDFVYQRPQHLLSRCAQQRRVFFVEEPVFIDGPASLDISQRHNQLYIVAPLLPKHFSRSKRVIDRLQPQFVDEAFRDEVDELQRQFLDELYALYNTKTLEYLAAGKPVVSTSIRDVVSPYGDQGIVRIADTPAEFVAAVEDVLNESIAPLLPKIDALLKQTSWDVTWTHMCQLIEGIIANQQTAFKCV